MVVGEPAGLLPTARSLAVVGVDEGSPGGCWQVQCAQGTSPPLFVWYEKLLEAGVGGRCGERQGEKHTDLAFSLE